METCLIDIKLLLENEDNFLLRCCFALKVISIIETQCIMKMLKGNNKKQKACIKNYKKTYLLSDFLFFICLKLRP